MPGDDAESDDEKDDEAAGESPGAKNGTAVLTAPKLDELIDAAFREQRLRGLQYVLHAFRAGAHSQDETPPTGLRFRIESNAVFTRMLGSVLTNARAAFSHHLGGQVASVGPFTAVQLTKCKRFKKLSPLLQSFLTNLIHMLGHTLDASILLLLLRALKLYIPFYAAYPKLAQRLTRSLLKLYSAEFPPTVRIGGEGDDEHPEQDAAPSANGKRGRKRSRGDAVASEADLASALADGPGHDGGITVRAVTFLRLRQCAAELPYPTLDTVTKGVYLSYMRLSKNMAASEHRLPMARLMAAAVVELASLDATAAYQHGFTYLRQLALHLRAALTAKSPSAVTTVLSWQFLSALRVWTAVLIAHGSDDGSPLWQLVFPLTQLCMGVLQLTRTLHKYFYLRLHVLSCLVELGLRCSVFVPVPTHILDLLEAPHFVSGGGKPPKGSGGKPPSFATTLRLTEGAVGSKPVLDHVVGTGTALLSRWLASVWDSVAFPELVTPLAIRLRKWIKDARTGGWKGAGNNVLKSINARSKTVMGHRASTPGLAPSDLEAVAAFQTRALRSGNNALQVGGQEAADEALTLLWHTGTAGRGGDGVFAALGVGGVATRGTASAEAAIHRAAAGQGDGTGDDARVARKGGVSWGGGDDSDALSDSEGAPAAVHAAKRARRNKKSLGGAAAAPKQDDMVQAFSMDGLDDSGDELVDGDQEE
jgi:nucleolar complex protein 2